MQESKKSKSQEMKIDRTTLHVYWFVIENSKNGVGARRVQKALGFKSPSSAIFHLDKLREAQLLRKERSGVYILTQPKKFGVMRYFVFVGRRLVPKHLFYALIVSIATIFAWILTEGVWSIEFFLSFLPAILAALILWYQTFEVWREKPNFRKTNKA